MATLEVRLADKNDLAAINDIYNHYVLESTTSYDYQPWTIQQRREWFADRDAVHPVTVAHRAGKLVGWGALGEFRSRSAYRVTAEDSVYVHPDHLREGVGASLMRDLIERAAQLGLRSIVAGIDAEQTASVALHQKFGFQEVARFHQVGYKFDRWLDVLFMQLMLPVDARDDASRDATPG